MTRIHTKKACRFRHIISVLTFRSSAVVIQSVGVTIFHTNKIVMIAMDMMVKLEHFIGNFIGFGFWCFSFGDPKKIFNEIRDHCNYEQKLNCRLIDLMTRNMYFCRSMQLSAEAFELLTQIHKELKYHFWQTFHISFIAEHWTFRWYWKLFLFRFGKWNSLFIFYCTQKSASSRYLSHMICNLRTNNNIATTLKPDNRPCRSSWSSTCLYDQLSTEQNGYYHLD